MKIKIDPFDKESIAKAIKQLKEYKKDFKKKEQVFIKKLAEIGVSVAQAEYAAADYDGVNDVQVRFDQSGTRASVIAWGDSVGFIEFGTGIRNPEWVDTDNVSGDPYTPPKHGTYGKGQGARPKGWYYVPDEGAKARHTYGNTPAEALLSARNEMVEKVIDIAREVWK